MGKRHHYIPRMLLRNFASRSDVQLGKYWVFQIGKNSQPEEISTKDAAVEKYFYGKGTGIEELLTNIEGRADFALKDIVHGNDAQSHSELLRSFVWVQSIRTRALKSAFTDATQTIINDFVKSATESRLRERINDRVLNSFDEIVFKELPHQLPSDRIVYEELVAVPGFKRIAQDAMIAKLTQENVAGTVFRFLSVIGNSGIVAEIVDAGFTKGMAKLMSTFNAPENFNPKYWKVQTFDEGDLILGDMCAFAVSTDGKPGSLQKFGIDAQYYILPISKNKLLIGMNELEEVSFNLQAINNASASLAWDYLYSPNGSTEHSMLGRLVNSTEPLIDNEELQVMVSKAWET